MEIKLARNFWRDKFIISISGLSLLLNLANWLLVFRNAVRQTEVVALHYNIYFGIDWIGPANNLYLYPFLALMMIIVNILLAWFLYGRQRFLCYLLLAVVVLVNFSFFLSSGLILLFDLT